MSCDPCTRAPSGCQGCRSHGRGSPRHHARRWLVSADTGNANAAKGKPKAKRKRRPKLSALFLLGSDGEVYATCPMPSPPVHIAREAEFILAIRLNRRELDILV